MSAKLQVTEKDLANHQFRGLANHGEYTLLCSACGVRLVEIILVDPNVDVTFNYRADCPHCGDHSNPLELTGRVIIGHTGKTVYTGFRDPKPNESKDLMYLTTAKA